MIATHLIKFFFDVGGSVVVPGPQLPFGGGISPSRKRLKPFLDELERSREAKQPPKVQPPKPPRKQSPKATAVGPVHTSVDDDEEALLWLLTNGA